MQYYGVVQAYRTSLNLHKPHQHRDSKVCMMLMHKFGGVQGCGGQNVWGAYVPVWGGSRCSNAV